MPNKAESAKPEVHQPDPSPHPSTPDQGSLHHNAPTFRPGYGAQTTGPPGTPMQVVMLPPPPVAGVPIGLELLLPLNRVFIKQEIELLEVIVDVETANRYSIMAGNGQRIYLARETTECCALFCGGSIRPFIIDISDVFGRPVLHLQRPCDCLLCWTTQLLFCCGQIGGKVIVSLPDGTMYGEIVHTFNMCKPKYLILDEAGKHLMTIEGPNCGDCCGYCCCTVDFPITSADGSQQIGVIRKTFSGIVQELFTDADNFGVEFPIDINIKWKALMLAAVFLIDFMYFEKSS